MSNKMADLVAELRVRSDRLHEGYDIFDACRNLREAADEIERLTLVAQNKEKLANNLRDECAKLRTALENIFSSSSDLAITRVARDALFL